MQASASITQRDSRASLLSLTRGLPEAGEPLCDALLDAVQPKVVVLADSEFPANRRSPPRLRERLEQKGIPAIFTRTAGAATLVAQPDGWELKTMDGRKYSGAARFND